MPVTRLGCCLMRHNLSLSLLLLFLAFCVFDEEPLFDATDWNAVHICLGLLSLFIVVWENLLRSRLGQYAYKDQVLVYALFSYWFALENYFRLIVIGFCLHCLTPLEIELLELVEVYQTLAVWTCATLLPALLSVTLCFWLGLQVAQSLAFGPTRLQVALVSALIVTLALNFFFLAWDLLFAGLSHYNDFADAAVYYQQTRTGLTYNANLGLTDQFDWHRETAQPFVMRFEDYYVFVLQLLNVVTLAACLFVWLILGIDLLASQEERSPAWSYTGLGVGLRWLDHCLWGFIYSHLALFWVSLRVTLRTPLEFTWLTV